MKKILTFFFAFIATFWAFGQEKCASHTNEQMMRVKYPHLGTVEQFEQWMAQKIAERRSNAIAQRSGPYTIPVIIHIIYDNASWQVLNNTRNITYAQAESQIRVLNRDFNQTNLDFSTVVRPIFQPKASSLNVTFIPATKDPNGNFLTEPGVERINGQERFNIQKWSGPGGSSDNTLKPQTIWDPTKYLNIWVVEFEDTGLFGYATFPPYLSLPGNPGGATSSNDGVVITWRAFGSNTDPDTGNPTNYVSNSNLLCTGCDRGRTTTHELGHWLGLRHIWGDSNSGCTNANNNDYCEDTPFTTGPNNPTFPCTSPDKCPSTAEPAYGMATLVPDQRENYMDYSADQCMGMFSQEQVARMETIMDNSPQRTSLTNPTNIAAVAPTRPAGLYVIIYSEKVKIFEGESISFAQVSQAESVPAPTTYNWNFDVDGLGGVSPATFSGANPPTIAFSKAGSYKIRLTISNGTNTAQSNIINVEVGLKAPSNLQFLDVIGSGSNAKVENVAKLKWNDNSGSEDNYIVERKKNTEPPTAFATIATLPANTTTYDDEFANASPAVETGITYNYRVSAVKGSLKASTTKNIILERTTALDDTPLAREVRIYPNPTQSSFNVDLSGLQVSSAKLQLHNTIGQVVAQKVVAGGEVNFDVQNLPKGMYLLKIDTEKGAAVKRILIQ